MCYLLPFIFFIMCIKAIQNYKGDLWRVLHCPLMKGGNSVYSRSVNCTDKLNHFHEDHSALNVTPPTVIQWGADIEESIHSNHVKYVLKGSAYIFVNVTVDNVIGLRFATFCEIQTSHRTGNVDCNITFSEGSSCLDVSNSLRLWISCNTIKPPNGTCRNQIQDESKVPESAEDLHSHIMTYCANATWTKHNVSEISIHISIISEQLSDSTDQKVTLCIVYIIIVISAAVMMFMLFRKGRRLFMSVKDERKKYKLNSDLHREDISPTVDVQERRLILSFEQEEATEYFNFQSSVDAVSLVGCRDKSKRLNYIEVEINRDTKVVELTDEGHQRQSCDSVEYSTIDKVATLTLAQRGNHLTMGDTGDDDSSDDDSDDSGSCDDRSNDNGRVDGDDEMKKENIYSNTKTITEEIVQLSYGRKSEKVDYVTMQNICKVVENDDNDNNEEVVDEISQGASSQLAKNTVNEIFQNVQPGVGGDEDIDEDHTKEENVYANSKAVMDEILRVASMEIVQLIGNEIFDMRFSGEVEPGLAVDDCDTDAISYTTSNTSGECGAVIDADQVDSAKSECYRCTSVPDAESSVNSVDASDNHDYATGESGMKSGEDGEIVDSNDNSHIVADADSDKSEYFTRNSDELGESIYGNINETLKDMNRPVKENIPKMLLDKL